MCNFPGARASCPLSEEAGGTTAILQPNAVAPKQTSDGVCYDATPEEMAACRRAAAASDRDRHRRRLLQDHPRPPRRHGPHTGV